ncbi:EamA family transporter [Conexibacter woesei]|uniref:EamA family transporter n=1 Tax=Conexibacter woesei TaxID=191495 RepID=UPI00040D1AEE|nr:EamA family transporter [Conexibacter woesei]
MAIALALAAAASWGTADFLAGLASRRLSVPVVLLLVEGGGLVVIALVAILGGAHFFDHPQDALSAIGGGLAGMVGLGCFYRALAIGTMSVVAPISAAGVALPVVVGVATGNRPSALTAAGLAAIVAGVVLASREEHDSAQAAAAGRAALVLALISAVGFGGFFALTDAPADASVPWTLVLSRAAPMPFVAAIIAYNKPAFPAPRLGLAIACVGCVDLLATTLIAIANTRGELSVVSVLGGMYPVVTVLLAAAVLHERVRPPQVTGIVLALGGVACVAAGA